MLVASRSSTVAASPSRCSAHAFACSLSSSPGSSTRSGSRRARPSITASRVGVVAGGRLQCGAPYAMVKAAVCPGSAVPPPTGTVGNASPSQVMVAWLTRIDRSELFVTPALRLRVPSSERNWVTEASSRSGAGVGAARGAGSAEQPARHASSASASTCLLRITLAPWHRAPALSTPDLWRYGYGGDTPRGCFRGISYVR